jgi:hypothetical protein
MCENYIKAIDAVKQYGLYLKVATSTKLYGYHTKYYDLYADEEEPCRKVVVLTPYKELEEVCEQNSSKPIETNVIIDGSIWLKEYSLGVDPKNINFDDLLVQKELVQKLVKSLEN